MLRIALLAGLVFLTSVFAHADRITAYSPDEHDSKPYHGRNCLGFSVLQKVEGHGQAATDHRVYPLGSILRITGIATVIVTDCGSKVRGRHIDVAMRDTRAVRAFSHVHDAFASVTVLRMGWAKLIPGPKFSPVAFICSFSPTIHDRQSSKRSWV